MNSPSWIPTPKIWKPREEKYSGELPGDWDSFHEVSQVDASLPREGYRIELTTRGLDLRIGSSAALLYAWQHVQQWPSTSDGSWVCGVLEDSPAMERRGFMLDISRCKVPTREQLEKWVTLLAGFRYNELQLYTEHTFAYPQHPGVWEDASPMTADDIRWLQKLCRAQGIELVPNQNCFGHFERWIKHPEYRRYAESPKGFITPWGDRRDVGSVLKPDNASFEFVCGLLDEMLPLFESSWVNIGCDETFELGQGFSKVRCESEGSGRVYTEFVTKLMEYVFEKHGKRAQFWGDILLKTPEELKNLPGNVLALEWGYEADHPFAEESRKFSESGLDFVICPGTSSWRSFTGRTENMLENIRNATIAATENRAKGMVLTDWGDCGHLQQSPVSYPALAWCGLNAWNPEKARIEDAGIWCDRIAFEGNNGDTACWLAAGRISDHLKETSSNASLIFKLFEQPLQCAKKIPEDQLRCSLEAMDLLPSPQTHQAEWRQTLRHVRLSLLTALKLQGDTSNDLRPLLEETREEHRKLWLERNREGGLAESLSMYTEVNNLLISGENL